jgi:hypothetical protein
MVGTNGSKFPAIRKHLDENIGKVYKDMDTSFVAFPEEGKIDAEAYKTAIDKMSPGDAVIVFTPDSTIFFPPAFIKAQYLQRYALCYMSVCHRAWSPRPGHKTCYPTSFAS